ncbi:MAG: hypothetical protein JXK95_15600, partial [Bacteroidales bacterium]|nr:hypothetical protein [Bacteroidales bacterium]
MRKVFIILGIITLSLQLKANNDAGPDSLITYQRADLSYVFGCQIYNDNFQYDPGFSFQGSFGMMINEFVGFGIGAGHQVFQHEKFIPLFVEAVGYKKDKCNTPFVKMQAGYSIGWHTGTVDMEGYRYRGGFHFDAGIGRKFPV